MVIIGLGGLQIKFRAAFKAVALQADKMKVVKVLLRAVYGNEFLAQERRDHESDDAEEDHEGSSHV